MSYFFPPGLCAMVVSVNSEPRHMPWRQPLSNRVGGQKRRCFSPDSDSARSQKQHVAAESGSLPVHGGHVMLHARVQCRFVDLTVRFARPHQENPPQNGRKEYYDPEPPVQVWRLGLDFRQRGFREIRIPRHMVVPGSGGFRGAGSSGFTRGHHGEKENINPRVPERCVSVRFLRVRSVCAALWLRLLSSAGNRPLVLSFGSCSWPPFMFKLEEFKQLVRDFSDVADFLVIYVAEAHSAGQ